MKKHLDIFLALVVIVAVGDAASLFAQGPVQQQQPQAHVGGLGFPALGGSPPTGIDGVFSGGTGGGLVGSQGSSLGLAPGRLGGGGGARGIDASRRTAFGGVIGGEGGVPGTQGLLGGNNPGGPFNRGGSGPTASGSNLGSSGGGSGALAPSAFGQSGQPLRPSVTELGGSVPGSMGAVFAGGSGGGPGGSLGSTVGTVPMSLGGDGRVGPTDARRREVYGNGFGGPSGATGIGGLYGQGSAAGSLDRGVGRPTASGSGTGLLGGGSGAGPGRGSLVGTGLSGSRSRSQGPVSRVLGTPGPGLSPDMNGILTLGGSRTGGFGVGGTPEGRPSPGNARSPSALSPSLGSGGPLGPEGREGSRLSGGPLPTPNLPSGPASTFGTETGPGTSFTGLPGDVLGSALSPSQGGTGPFSPGGIGGSGVAGGSLSAPSLTPGLGRSVVTETGPGLPGSPGLSIGVRPGARGSSGPGGSVSIPGGTSTGPSARTPLRIGGERAGTRLTAGSFSGRRTSLHRPRTGKLSPEVAAAIGLGVTGGALALTALAAGIASAVNKRHNGIKPVAAATGCPGCLPTRCVGNCGRKRRSIAMSKVPAEILNGIPVNFERLY